jgi:hypothetical protein
MRTLLGAGLAVMLYACDGRTVDLGGNAADATGVSTNLTASATVCEGGTSTDESCISLMPSPAGNVEDSTTGIAGQWYAYGDMWGSADGQAPGSCQAIGMFMQAQCSDISFPRFSDMPDAGAVGFPPGGAPGAPAGAPAGAMCLSGLAAEVPQCNNPAVSGCTASGSTTRDYLDVWGIEIGLPFNDTAGTKLPYNAVAHNVIGFEFDVTGVPPGGILVELPTTDTAPATGPQYEPYAVRVVQDGHVRVDLTTTPSDPNHLSDNVSAPPIGQPMFNAANLLAIQFHVATSAGGSVPVSLVCVNNLAAVAAP